MQLKVETRRKRMGKAVKALRITCGLSSEDLAKELGISRYTMLKVENDPENLSLLYYHALSDIFMNYSCEQSGVAWLYGILVEGRNTIYNESARNKLIKCIEEYSLTLSRKSGSAMIGWKVREQLKLWRENWRQFICE